MSGYIKIHRDILGWEWYNNHNTKIVFFHLLIKANYEPKKWQGINISRGQFITSYQSLSEQLHLSVKQIRTALKNLKKTGEVAIKVASKYSIITICKYEHYQGNGNTQGQAEWQTTGTVKGQAKGKQRATTKEYKELEEDKEEKNIIPFGQFWDVYENKKGKVQAEKLWAKLTNEEREKAIKAIPLYEESKKDSPKKFWKHGSTYLSQRVWEDFEVPPPKPITLNPKHYWSDQDYVKALKQHGHDIPEHLRQYA